jgi:hypothetical protein
MMPDDPMTEDLRELLGPDFDELESEEQYRQVKKLLKFEEYAPSTVPAEAVSELYNPALDGYRDAGLTWGDRGWEPIDNTLPLGDYPEYIPTDEAIRTLIKYGPVVEVGAGKGYWAHVLNENGGDCIPTDLNPEDETGEFPVTTVYSSEDGEQKYSSTVWAGVEELDGAAAVTAYPERTVMMCHPEGTTHWSKDVLDAIEDQFFIYIGEWFPGADANPLLFKRLADEFDLVERFLVFDWASMHAAGYVFKRGESR